MKVVEKGEVPPDTWSGACRYCGCRVAEVGVDEVIRRPSMKPAVPCPTPKCPAMIWLIQVRYERSDKTGQVESVERQKSPAPEMKRDAHA